MIALDNFLRDSQEVALEISRMTLGKLFASLFVNAACTLTPLYCGAAVMSLLTLCPLLDVWDLKILGQHYHHHDCPS